MTAKKLRYLYAVRAELERIAADRAADDCPRGFTEKETTPVAHPPHQTERDIKQELKPEGGAMGARKWGSVAVEGSLAVVLGIALIVGILSGWSWLSGASPDPHCTLRFQNYIEHHLLVDGRDHISCRRVIE